MWLRYKNPFIALLITELGQHIINGKNDYDKNRIKKNKKKKKKNDKEFE